MKKRWYSETGGKRGGGGGVRGLNKLHMRLRQVKLQFDQFGGGGAVLGKTVQRGCIRGTTVRYSGWGGGANVRRTVFGGGGGGGDCKNVRIKLPNVNKVI